jgi:large subunit ribosomal protein L31
MKSEIHPTYYPDAKVTCASCGNTWTTGSTRKELRVDICSKCHPFFSGEAARIIDIEGQVDRFYKKLQARQTHVQEREAREAARNSPDKPIEELGLSTRATEALKKAGLEKIGQLMDLLAQGDKAVLAIAGFGQSSLTTAKKKLRTLGYELPEAASA